jgi:hypothetical protein
VKTTIFSAFSVLATFRNLGPRKVNGGNLALLIYIDSCGYRERCCEPPRTRSDLIL